MTVNYHSAILPPQTFLEPSLTAAREKIKAHYSAWQKNLARVAVDIPLAWDSYENTATVGDIAKPSYQVIPINYSEIEKINRYYSQNVGKE